MAGWWLLHNPETTVFTHDLYPIGGLGGPPPIVCLWGVMRQVAWRKKMLCSVKVSHDDFGYKIVMLSLHTVIAFFSLCCPKYHTPFRTFSLVAESEWGRKKAVRIFQSLFSFPTVTSLTASGPTGHSCSFDLQTTDWGACSHVLADQICRIP